MSLSCLHEVIQLKKSCCNKLCRTWGTCRISTSHRIRVRAPEIHTHPRHEHLDGLHGRSKVHRHTNKVVHLLVSICISLALLKCSVNRETEHHKDTRKKHIRVRINSLYCFVF